MLSIEATNLKLAEAQFFCRKLSDISRRTFSSEPEAFGFYLSAFLSAGRSVTLALQAEQKQKYDAWFPEWLDSLNDEEKILLGHFNDQRVATVHKTGATIAHRVETISALEYLMAASREGVNIELWPGVPGTPLPTFQKVVRSFTIGENVSEVAKACDVYAELLARLVADFTRRYSGESIAT